jgi:hypothetical protein
VKSTVIHEVYMHAEYLIDLIILIYIFVYCTERASPELLVIDSDTSQQRERGAEG